MKLKDFKPGQQVFILIRRSGEDDEIARATVKSVGTKYVRAYTEKEGQHLWTYRHYCEAGEDRNFLLEEEKEFGETSLLFKSAEEAAEFIERNELYVWLSNSLEEKDHSLEQLRAARRALGG